MYPTSWTDLCLTRNHFFPALASIRLFDGGLFHLAQLLQISLTTISTIGHKYYVIVTFFYVS